MDKKVIEGLYVFGAYVEPMQLAGGIWCWVVKDFASDPDIYDEEGTPLEIGLFSLMGDSEDELLNPFNEQEEQK